MNIKFMFALFVKVQQQQQQQHLHHKQKANLTMGKLFYFWGVNYFMLETIEFICSI